MKFPSFPEVACPYCGYIMRRSWATGSEKYTVTCDSFARPAKACLIHGVPFELSVVTLEGTPETGD